MPFDGTRFDNLETIRTIDAVIELLLDEERWVKGALINGRRQMCLVGAMQTARAAPALTLLMLHAIADVTGRRFSAIETFNDDESTTHGVLMEVLNRARMGIFSGEYATVPGDAQPLRPEGIRALLQRSYMKVRQLAW